MRSNLDSIENAYLTFTGPLTMVFFATYLYTTQVRKYKHLYSSYLDYLTVFNYRLDDTSGFP